MQLSSERRTRAIGAHQAPATRALEPAHTARATRAPRAHARLHRSTHAHPCTIHTSMHTTSPNPNPNPNPNSRAPAIDNRTSMRMIPAPRAVLMLLLLPAPVPIRRRGARGRRGVLGGRKRPAPDLRDPFFHVGLLRLLLDYPGVREHLPGRGARGGVDGEAIQANRSVSMSETRSGFEEERNEGGEG